MKSSMFMVVLLKLKDGIFEIFTSFNNAVVKKADMMLPPRC